MSIPNEYNKQEATPQQMYVGTDIYLAASAGIWTGLMMHILMTTVAHVYNFVWWPNVVYMAMAIPSLVSSYNVLTDPNRMPRRRIWNSIGNSLNLVMFSPFTIPAQICQTMTSGINITRHLFD